MWAIYQFNDGYSIVSLYDTKQAAEDVLEELARKYWLSNYPLNVGFYDPRHPMNRSVKNIADDLDLLPKE